MKSSRDGTQVRHIEGVAVHVSGEGPGVVLLHANGGDHRDFDAVVAALSRSSTVYALDWPGHGDSPATESPTACGFAALLPRVLESLGPGPFALVGNSVGGFAAIRTAVERPDLVRRLVLVNPGGFTPRSPFSIGVCRLFGSERVAPTVMRLLPRLYLRHSSEAVEAVRARAVEASRVPARVRAYASMWRSFTDLLHDARRDIDAMTAPTLLIWGTHDRVLPWLIDGRRAARALPHATVVTLACGHQAFVEMPHEFLAAATPFLHETPGHTHRA
ncbi:MAG: alpha/beta fold hydrolase [Proteobacteria bacterium]|nr:alpha/beta fold hydrolase [Pseudomonadota bacterium]